jgi:hypothetical protein
MRASFVLSCSVLLACPLQPGRRCEDVAAEFAAESLAVRTCDVPEDCGQVLTGTSCGCTRDLVARLDADATLFYAVLDEANDRGCDLGLVSPCDCPDAHGFACVDGLCAWNYVDLPPAPYSTCRAEHGDDYASIAAAVDGDTLAVTVTYSGGCAEHAFVPCWPDQSFMESAPVQARLELWHDDHGDPCDAVIEDDIAIDLGPLRDAWHDAYGDGAGEIVIRFEDWSLPYTFPAR